MVVAMLVCATLVWGGWREVPAYLAHRRFDDLQWMKAANPDELRRTAHLALGWWLGDPHDAFIILGRYGDNSSVPFLRTALARRPSSNAVACTWHHGQEALDRILRHNAGEQ